MSKRKLVTSAPTHTEMLVAKVVKAIRPHFLRGVDPVEDKDYRATLETAIARAFGKISIHEARCLYPAVTATWNGTGLDEKSVECIAAITASDVLENWAAMDIQARTLDELATRVHFLWERAREDCLDESRAAEALSSMKCDIDNIKHPAERKGPKGLMGHSHVGRNWEDVEVIDTPDKVVAFKPRALQQDDLPQPA